MSRLISSPGDTRSEARMRKRFDAWDVETRSEYKRIQARKSKLSRSHRDFIVRSHEAYCEQFGLDPQA